jgi:hypothetical protein
MDGIAIVPASWYHQWRALPVARAAKVAEAPWNNWQPTVNNENTPMLSRDEHLRGLWRTLGTGD